MLDRDGRRVLREKKTQLSVLCFERLQQWRNKVFTPKTSFFIESENFLTYYRLASLDRPGELQFRLVLLICYCCRSFHLELR